MPRLGILRTSNLGTDENAISSEEGCGWCREELAIGPSAAGSTQLQISLDVAARFLQTSEPTLERDKTELLVWSQRVADNRWSMGFGRVRPV